ncbi:hypothetical protein KIPE111705_32915 [Kibdelosporangium persicum]|uniref:hypothetical protein n=1 Tax=Kibdelosporangium persicum TaxID=2698649 RepID=UPI001566AAA5|nr:hypothetical protein [Kibdelosporangium persicum]
MEIAWALATGRVLLVRYRPMWSRPNPRLGPGPRTCVGRVLGKPGVRDRAQAIVPAYEPGSVQPGRG